MSWLGFFKEPRSKLDAHHPYTPTQTDHRQGETYKKRGGKQKDEDTASQGNCCMTCCGSVYYWEKNEGVLFHFLLCFVSWQLFSSFILKETVDYTLISWWLLEPITAIHTFSICGLVKGLSDFFTETRKDF